MSTDDKKEHPKQPKKSSHDDFPIQEYRLVPADQSYGAGHEEDEIDLIELAKTIWDNRKTIYKFVGVGFVLGLLVALLSPKEYVSSATLMPEYSTESQGGASSLLKQFGGAFGLNGGSYSANSNAIRVDLYPQVVSSLTFQDKLARQEFYFPKYDTTTSIYDYFLEVKSASFFGALKKYSIGLPATIKRALSDEERSVNNLAINDTEIVELSIREMEVIENLRSRISASLNEESGIITVSAKMPDSKLAARVAKYTIDELTIYLTEYRTEKVMLDLDFIEEQLTRAEERFNAAQLALAEFQDSNQGNLTARARTDEQRLNSEYDVAFNVYDGLTQQYEQAKLKVQEETPVFKVLQPVQVPVDDDTSGVMILLVFIMLSGISSIGFIFIGQFLESNTSGSKF